VGGAEYAGTRVAARLRFKAPLAAVDIRRQGEVRDVCRIPADQTRARCDGARDLPVRRRDRRLRVAARADARAEPRRGRGARLRRARVAPEARPGGGLPRGSRRARCARRGNADPLRSASRRPRSRPRRADARPVAPLREPERRCASPLRHSWTRAPRRGGDRGWGVAGRADGAHGLDALLLLAAPGRDLGRVRVALSALRAARSGGRLSHRQRAARRLRALDLEPGGERRRQARARRIPDLGARADLAGSGQAPPVRAPRFSVAARLMLLMAALAGGSIGLALALQDRALGRDLEAAAAARLEGASSGAQRLLADYLGAYAVHYRAVSRTPEFRANLETGSGATLQYYARSLRAREGSAAVVFLRRDGTRAAADGDARLVAAMRGFAASPASEQGLCVRP